MHKKTYESIGETIFQNTLSNGLEVVLLPKQEMSKTYGIFMTNYGAIHRKFTPIGDNEQIEVPDGIAHFLEHKLFEKEDRDVFADFLSQGASPNAFTSFTKTAYLFSTTKNMTENVSTLLDFVQSPFFSDESVEKEKGIIGQEIKMYDDQPDWQAFMGTIKNMYKRHPVRIDIAGTVNSIANITKEHLYTCYNTFYHPGNMIIFVAGNFDETEMMQTIEANQSAKEFDELPNIDREYPSEAPEVATKENIIHMPITIPKVTVGIKETNKTIGKEEFLLRDTLQSMLLDYFFSPSGDFYTSLYESGLIDDSFEYSTTVEESFGFSLISSNSEKPEDCGRKIRELLLSTKDIQLDEDTFHLMKTKYIGQLLKSMNSLEFIANQFVHYHFMDIDFFTIIPYVESLTLEEANQFLSEWLTEEKITINMIKQGIDVDDE